MDQPAIIRVHSHSATILQGLKTSLTTLPAPWATLTLSTKSWCSSLTHTSSAAFRPSSTASNPASEKFSYSLALCHTLTPTCALFSLLTVLFSPVFLPAPEHEYT